MKKPYQQVHMAGTKQKWQIIRSCLDENDKTLLDVGCNDGFIVFGAAEIGIRAHGIDSNGNSIKRCKAQNNQPGLGLASFDTLELTPANIEHLGEYDIIGLLSVQHQWQGKFGKDESLEMLQTLGNKARSKFFFQPPSIRAKYMHPPDIKDNDANSIINHNMAMLEELFPDRELSYIGKSELVAKGEPFRHMFMMRNREDESDG